MAPGLPEGASTRIATRTIGMATSAGGLQAITEVLGHLPNDLRAAIVLVQHLAPDHRSFLAEIIRGRTGLNVCIASEGMPLEHGTVYVAPPGAHTTIDAAGHIHLSDAEKVHFVRPSADVMLESIAEHFGPNAIAVILTGTGSDGAEGLAQTKRAGGTTIVQSVDTAEYSGMPCAAIKTGAVDHIVPLTEIAATIIEVTQGA